MKNRKLYLFSLLFVAFFGLSSLTAFAKDDWIQVRSKNFYLIGNASEKEVRRVATRLEQFRETFRQVFRTMKVDSSVPTNVVVFKSDSAFKPFKPRRADGKADNLIAGYFQSGEDVNYVTLSADGQDSSNYGTIFHEYVHFLVNTNFGKSNVPSWFNEGLAEYYSTFDIADDQVVKLGYPDSNHLQLLAQSRLIPLTDLLTTRPNQWGGSHGRSIFYAQSWALVHYLVQTGKTDSLDKYLQLSLARKPPEHAFREAFGVDYPQMEKELRNYIGQRTFKYHSLTFKQKLTFDTEMNASPLTEGEVNAYLGDLLVHTQRPEDAEPFLRTALSLDPKSSMANMSLAMVKFEQRKYEEARTLLEVATKDSKNPMASYRLAELLMREDQDEFGYLRKMNPQKSQRIRELLKQAIALKPDFTESYELMAFLSLVNNENLDEAIAGLSTALRYRPGNVRYGLRAAEIYIRQDKLKEALDLAETIGRNTEEDNVRERADRIVASIKQRQEMLASDEAEKKRYEASKTRPSQNGGHVLVEVPADQAPSEEKLSRLTESVKLRALNQALRALPAGEKRVIGWVAKIDCKAGVSFAIKTSDGQLQLFSKGFQELDVVSFVEREDLEVGCNSNLVSQMAVISYRPDTASKPGFAGRLTAVEFVPKEFRFLDLAKEPVPPTFVTEHSGDMNSDDPEEARRRAMLKIIAENLRKPGPGEKRILGYIEKSECTNKGAFFTVKVGSQILLLSDAQPQSTLIRSFTRDGGNLQIGCGMKSVDIPVVIVYTVSSDLKGKSVGDVVSMEFVPKNFQLDQ